MFEAAAQIARSVLYEGYLLYPYRASALKNRSRWQFGTVVPKARAMAGHGERDRVGVHVLGLGGDDDVIHVHVRLLHMQSRAVQVQTASGWAGVTEVEGPDGLLRTWDEAVEVDIRVQTGMTLDLEEDHEVPGSRDVEHITDDIRVVRQRWPLQIRLGIAARSVAPGGPADLRAIEVEVANTSPWDPCEVDELTDPDRADPRVQGRDSALRRSLLSAHLLIGLESGEMVSTTDPPSCAADAAAALPHEGLWPSLIGRSAGSAPSGAGGPDRGFRTPPASTGQPRGGGRPVVLAAPIILGDQPSVAPESPRDLFDGTEIDELLTLRTLTLTDEEKREARRTDARAAAIVDHVEAMPPDELTALHGTTRSVVDWWEPAADASVSPETDLHPVHGVQVGRGHVVTLRPSRRADAQDMFLDGLLARVEAVLHDVDGGVTFAVTLLDDPGADLMAQVGRYRYFSTDEIVPDGHLPAAVPPDGERPADVQADH